MLTVTEIHLLAVAATGRRASLYACGITPYDATHIGHAATYTAWDLSPFARDLGDDGPPFRWDEDRRFLLRAELGISDERAVEYQHGLDDGVEHGERLRRAELGASGSTVERFVAGTNPGGEQHREDGG